MNLPDHSFSIGAARKNAKMSQEYVANALGISRHTWSNYENYRSTPGVDVAFRIAELFDLPIDVIRWEG